MKLTNSQHAALSCVERLLSSVVDQFPQLNGLSIIAHPGEKIVCAVHCKAGDMSFHTGGSFSEAVNKLNDVEQKELRLATMAAGGVVEA